jgi:hypothetical protein
LLELPLIISIPSIILVIGQFAKIYNVSAGCDNGINFEVLKILHSGLCMEVGLKLQGLRVKVKRIFEFLRKSIDV